MGILQQLRIGTSVSRRVGLPDGSLYDIYRGGCVEVGIQPLPSLSVHSAIERERHRPSGVYGMSSSGRHLTTPVTAPVTARITVI